MMIHLLLLCKSSESPRHMDLPRHLERNCGVCADGVRIRRRNKKEQIIELTSFEMH